MICKKCLLFCDVCSLLYISRQLLFFNLAVIIMTQSLYVFSFHSSLCSCVCCYLKLFDIFVFI